MSATPKRRSQSTLSRLIREAEKNVARLAKERDRITEDLSGTSDYLELAALGNELTDVQERLSSAENEWLALGEEAEQDA